MFFEPTSFGTHLAAHARTPSTVFLLRLLPLPDDVVEFCLRLLRFNNKSFVVPLFSLFFHSLYTLSIHYIYTLYLYTISIHSIYTLYLYTISILYIYTLYLYTNFLSNSTLAPPFYPVFETHLAAHARTPSTVFLLRLLPLPDDVVEFCLRLLRFNNKSFVVPLFSLFFQKFLTLFSLSFSSSSPLFSLFFHSLHTISIHDIYTLYLYTISIHIHSPSSLLSL